MKNIQLIAFLFIMGLSAAGALGLSAQNKNYSLAFRSDYDFSKKEMINSTRLGLPYFQARASIESDFSLPDYNFYKSRWNYGLMLSTQKAIPKFQINFLTGNLAAAGSLSKLNSPALSSLSGSFYSQSPLKAKALEITLPGYNSFTLPQGYGLLAHYKNSSFLQEFSLNLFYKSKDKSDTQSFSANLFCKIKAGKKTDVAWSFCGGIYPYDKKNLSSWFTQQAFYKAGRHICFNNQLSLQVGGFSSLFIISSYQSPFGDFLNTWRSENLFKFGNTSFKLDCFYNPNIEILTSSDKKLSPLLQINAGSQYRFLVQGKNPTSFTTGIKAQAEINLLDNIHTLKGAAGIRYSNGFATGSLQSQINLNLKNEGKTVKTDLASCNIQASNTFYVNDFYPSLNGKITFTPDYKKEQFSLSESFGLNFEYKSSDAFVSLSNKNQIIINQKSGQTKSKIEYDFSFKASFKISFVFLDFNFDFKL